MNKEQLKKLTREELFVFAAEANSTDDQELVDQITDELKERNNNKNQPPSHQWEKGEYGK